MKIKCDSIVRCGNYNCVHNDDGYVCLKQVIALDINGQCALCRPKHMISEGKIPKSPPNPISEKTNAC